MVAFHHKQFQNMSGVGRNEPCPCGSGKKYKRCCLESTRIPVLPWAWHELRQMEGKLYSKIERYAEEVFESDDDFWEEAWEDFEIPEEYEPSDDDAHERFYTQLFEKWALFQWKCLPPDDGDIWDEDLPMAELFRLEHGDKLTPLELRYIDQATRGFFSFFEILDAQPGYSIQLKDLFTGKEFTILEQRGSQNAQPGYMMFALPIQFKDFSVMLATGIVLLPPSIKGPLLKLRKSMREKSPTGEVTHEIMRQPEVQDLLFEAYLDIQRDILEPKFPMLQNTDGELMQLIKLTYEISLTPEQTIERLKDLAVGWTDDDFDAHTERNKKGEFIEAEVLWLKLGNEKMPGWENTILGKVIIKKNSMTVEINSEERSSRIQKEIEQRLGDAAKLTSNKIESPQELLLKSRRRRLTAGEKEEERKNKELNESPEVQALIREQMEKHWKAWVDMALPALDGRTPREAVQDPDGREMVEALIFEAEERELTRPPLTRIDLAEIRRTLGLELQPR